MMGSRSLEEVGRQIFGSQDPETIGRWVQYWEESRRRNSQQLEMFAGLVRLDFTGKRVLDIGCGTGGLGELVGEGCRLYAGGDYNPHVLQFADPAANRSYLRCDGIGLPFADGCFDYIFAFDVVEHLVGGSSWQIQFFQELRRVLQPLGMIFLTTPNFFYPYDAHTQLYGPQYLPPFLRDSYIGWLNPGFLREHQSFSAIRLLTPGKLRRFLRKSGLCFLHDLPCGQDRRGLLPRYPLRALLAYAGLGWYPHAEFWGILVSQERRADLRLKLHHDWYYETNQPSPGSKEFGPCIDFEVGTFGHQLGSGWHWHERDNRGFRWTSGEASCYLESRSPVSFLRLCGFSPGPNHLEVLVDGLRVGEYITEEPSTLDLEYLLPFPPTPRHIFRVQIRCERTFQPETPEDRRALGLMIFSLAMV